jgi:ABC-type anion transport system duplicated permease subunit
MSAKIHHALSPGMRLPNMWDAVAAVQFVAAFPANLLFPPFVVFIVYVHLSPGLGAYIADATDRADIARVVLGVMVTSVFIQLFNRLLWRPLYAYSERHLRLG